MDLSVCITTYNLEKEIDETLESVFAQKTDYSFEVLIGDDGSSDDTLKRILLWEEKYPDIISHYQMPREKDKKYNSIFRASENRVNLLKHAKGKYITFLDGDDFYIDNSKFQTQIDILEKHPEYSISAHSMNFYYPDGTTKPFDLVYSEEKVIDGKDFWASGKYIHAEACIIRRDSINFTERYNRYFDDNFIVFLGLQNGKLHYIPKEMANYRQNPDGFMNCEKTRINIINTIDLDMEIQYNPDWKTCSLQRHSQEYFYLLKCKNMQFEKDYPQLYTQALEYNCRYTLSALSKNKFKKENLEALANFLIVKAKRAINKFKR
ncbi:MAG: glycosyltransferase family 2 protein [Ruminococcaceae bacterium]|nr:glycosyltransferase family 2 protein [Oscillospiraceae bacterium]